MSLEQAYALQGKRITNDPVQRGLSAGESAYRSSPQRGGLDMGGLRSSVGENLDQAAAQRQMLANNAAKQASGLYGNTGTSAAAYDYMRGRAGYPINAVPEYKSALPARPIQQPYEVANKVGTPTQTDLANTAKTSATKMGARPTPPGVAKPSMMNQLLGTLGPMYLGYTLLDKTGGLNALTGLGTAYNNLMYPTGVYGAEGNLLATDPANYFAPAANTAPAITEKTIADLSDPSQNPYLTKGPAVDVASTEATIPEGVAVDNVVGSTAIPVAEGASSVGYVNGADLASDAAMSQADLAAAEAGAEAAGLDWAAMTAEYGPYVAAAIIADQVLLDGKLSKGVGDIIQGAGDVVENVVNTVGDTGQDIIDTGTGVVEDLWEGVTGGCFMTTAAVEHAGEKDDGKTLTAMRKLRDDYLKKMPEGRKEIEWYYRKAPKIVDAIDKKPNAHALYMRMYNDHIKPTAKAVEAGKMELAHQRYNKMIGFAKKVSGLSTKELEAKTKQGIPKDIKKNFNGGGMTAFADGGLPQQYNLGGYSDGGRLLKGPGDGVSDSIPATIGRKNQPARLADGEFVVPARIVSELGNGSTEAGARKLYAMMDRVQANRKKSIGKGKVAVNSRADKHLPA
jgi:hypothetical protein